MYDGIVFQAILITSGIFCTLLFLYKTRIIKATENFKLGIVAATGGIAIVYLVNLVMSFFGGGLPVMDINNNLDNPIINFRAYSDNAETVSKFGTEFIRGVQDNGTRPT